MQAIKRQLQSGNYLVPNKPLISPPRTTRNGFSLLELLVVIVIMGVMAAVGAPSLVSMLSSVRVKGATSKLHVALLMARSEAIKRNAVVTIVPNTAGWAEGWEVRDAASAVLASEGQSRLVQITTAATQIVYLPSGRIQGTAPSFTLANTNNSVSTKCVTIDLSGRPYVKANACP